MEYAVVDGAIVERPVTMADIPPWDPEGTGRFSVATHVAFCRPLLARGATLLGAFAGTETAGLAVVEAPFEPGLAWLAWCYVSRPFRRRGAGTALWEAACAEAIGSGADHMYVSAAPTGSAVGFYLAQGCVLATTPHPGLYELEPDDVHLTCRLPRP